MIRIDQMYVSPVKSLALVPITSARLDKPGIAGDRAFFITDVATGNLFTQREFGPLVQIKPSYDVATGELQLCFPDGSTLSGVPELGEAITTSFFGIAQIEGRVLQGGWNDALSAYAGVALKLVKANVPGRAFDAYPISMCSNESIGAFARAAQRDRVDGRRFRQNIYLSGVSKPHEEDDWIGGEVRVGKALLRAKLRDSRCVMTTTSPETGEPDMDTLRIIPRSRTDQPKEVNFGVYCTVIEAGEASVGDEVSPVS
jgi:uncharacterized protein YcbX